MSVQINKHEQHWLHEMPKEFREIFEWATAYPADSLNYVKHILLNPFPVDVKQKKNAITTLHALLCCSVTHDFAADFAANSGLIPKLVDYLNSIYEERLQLIVTSVLINLAEEKTRTNAMVEAGAVPALVKILKLANFLENVEKAAMCLYNISYYLDNNEKILLEGNVIPPLVKWAEHCLQVNQTENDRTSNIFTNNLRLTRLIVLVMSTASMGLNAYPMDLGKMLPLVLVLCRVLNEYQNPGVLTYTCRALTNILHEDDCRVQKIEVFVDSGCGGRLIALLGNRDNREPLLSESALKLVVNITAAGNSRKIATILNCRLLQTLVALLYDADSETVGNACHALANIAHGSQDRIRDLFSIHLMPRLIQMLRQGTFEIKMKVVKIFRNIAKKGSLTQLEYIVEEGAFEVICFELEIRHQNAKLVFAKLCLLELILGKRKQMRKGMQNWLSIIHNWGGTASIYKLASQGGNAMISQKAKELIENFSLKKI